MDVKQIQNDIISEFSALGDWMVKLQHLVRLGQQHKVDRENLCIDANAVRGCQSNAWISAKLEAGRLYFQADSDSLIIRGLIVLLLRVINGQLPESVANTDLFFLKESGLADRLSPSRSNGLGMIIEEVKAAARKLNEIR